MGNLRQSMTNEEWQDLCRRAEKEELTCKETTSKQLDMTGWTEREESTVKIIHHSTSSSIEMLITTNEEVEQGKVEKVTTKVWFDYGTFSDLRKVVNQTNFP